MTNNVYGIDLGTCNMKIYCKASNKIMNEKNTIAGIATARPNAVVYMDTEIPWASKACFCAGSAVATAWNDKIRPWIVPRRPINVATLANMER